jgi:hypothetical protein
MEVKGSRFVKIEGQGRWGAMLARLAELWIFSIVREDWHSATSGLLASLLSNILCCKTTLMI